MDLGRLLLELHPENRDLLRKREKTIYKHNNATVAVDFNKTCIINGLLPKYTYCRRASSRRITPQQRMHYLKGELKEKQNLVSSLTAELEHLKEKWREKDVPEHLRRSIEERLTRLGDQHLSQAKQRIGRKLSTLYGGPIETPRQIDQFINLSSSTLTEDQRAFLNLGLNCHYMNKPKALEKRIELEILLDEIQQLERSNKVTASPDIQAEIIREANTTRGHTRSSLLTPTLRAAAKELRNNDNIVIRRADKSSVFVILDKNDYINKMMNILQDNTKFTRITKNTTNDLKTRLNRIIRSNNKKTDTQKLPLIEGDYSPGYAYGNVKVHKAGNPLRPIISQTPSVTYKLAKHLNDLLSPYTPSSFSLKSTEEFLDIVKSTRPANTMASMDVESLFTNVPVDETINLICHRIYHSNETPLSIPEESLRSLLRTCTKEVPFYGPDGKMYVQCDGVAMGSPLGPLFANFYMGSIENKIFFHQPELKPSIYVRYVDDIFLNTDTESDVTHLVNTFKENSSLNFTYEMEDNGKLPFLDVMVQRNTTSFSTEVYVKSTNLGFCLNGASECPEKYLLSVINSFVRRAFTHCSTWTATNLELNRISQLLSNNGYSKETIDATIRRHMDSYMHQHRKEEAKQQINLFYKNYMSSAYKEEEKTLKKIITNNVKPTDPDTKLNLVIYYKSRRTSNLVMRNSCLPPTTKLQEVNVVYQHTCTVGDCSRLNSRYIGFTTTTLSRRITAHLQDGAIKRHYRDSHGILLTRKHMDENTTIISKETNKRRLKMTEAVYINTDKPIINVQLQPEMTLPTRRHPTGHTHQSLPAALPSPHPNPPGEREQ